VPGAARRPAIRYRSLWLIYAAWRRGHYRAAGNNGDKTMYRTATVSALAVVAALAFSTGANAGFKHDVKELGHDMKEFCHDKREARHDRNELIHDIKSGNFKDIKRDLKDLRDDRKALRADRRDIRHDVHKINNDF
jgi:hypothetical protein